MSKFGEKIKDLRIKADLTLNEVAKFLEVKVSYLSDVEHGRKKPFSPNSILKFSKLLKVDHLKLQKLALEDRDSIEIPLVAKNSKFHNLAYALARSADSGNTEELESEIKKFLSGDKK